MGRRDGDAGEGGDGGVLEWIDDVEKWDEKTRRQFLAVLIATVVGVLTTIILYIQGMFEPLTQIDDIDEKPGDPPVNVFVQEYENEYRAADAEGNVIESGSDGWAVLEAAVRTVPPEATVSVNGRYRATSTIEIEKPLHLDGHGATISLDETVEEVFNFHGDERYQTELTERAKTGAHTVELDAVDDIEKGDMLLFEDTEAAGVLGRGQPPGEPHSVLEVDGRTVTVEDTIVWKGGYPSGTRVYVLDPIQIRCSGFELHGPAKDGSHTGIIARSCRDSVFEELRLDTFGNRGIALEGCANSRIRDCTALQSSDIDSGDGYGIQVRAGCHDIVVEGCTAKECRHPFSVTPAGPREVASRSIIVRDGFFSADGSAALNCHGGSAHDIKFKGCMVHTWGEAGVRTGAQKTSVSGCEFRMDGHHAVTTRNDGQDMIITVTDTDIYGASNAVELDDDDDYEFSPSWKLAHLEGVRANDCNRFFQLNSGSIDRVEKLVIRNCSWDTVREAGIRLGNRLEGGCIEGNSFGNAPNDSHIRVRGNETADVRNLHISGNRFEQSSGDETFIRFPHTTQCVISNNKFEANSGGRLYAEDETSTGNILKDNTYFSPNASGNTILDDGGVLVENNHFYDTENSGWS